MNTDEQKYLADLRSDDPVRVLEAIENPYRKEPFDFFQETDYALKWINLLPFRSGKYCKIFHPIYKSKIDYGDLTWMEWGQLEPVENSENIEASERKPYYFADLERGEPFTLMTWKQLAEETGIEYSIEIDKEHFNKIFRERGWPRKYQAPYEEEWTDILRNDIYEVLSRYYPYSNLWIYFDMLKCISTADYKFKRDHLYEGQLLLDIRLNDFFTDKEFITPTLVFDRGLNFSLLSEYEIAFTIVGGSEQLIGEFLNHPRIEALPLELSDQGRESPIL